MSILTCSVKDRAENPEPGSPPPQTASPASWTRMMCHHWLCHRIPVPALTLSNYHTNSLTRRLMRDIYYYCISKFVVLSLSSSLYFFPPCPSPLFIPTPPISASYSPLFPSLSPHSLVSGWKVQWGCGIPEGQGVCLLPEHSMCADQGLLISQSKLSAVVVDCLAV